MRTVARRGGGATRRRSSNARPRKISPLAPEQSENGFYISPDLPDSNLSRGFDGVVDALVVEVSLVGRHQEVDCQAVQLGLVPRG